MGDNRWTCKSCGYADNTGKFRLQCGSAKVVSWVCSSCGKNNTSRNFCIYCGAARNAADFSSVAPGKAKVMPDDAPLGARNSKDAASSPDAKGNTKNVTTAPSITSNTQKAAVVSLDTSNAQKAQATASTNGNNKKKAVAPSDTGNVKKAQTIPSSNGNAKKTSDAPSTTKGIQNSASNLSSASSFQNTSSNAPSVSIPRSGGISGVLGEASEAFDDFVEEASGVMGELLDKAGLPNTMQVKGAIVAVLFVLLGACLLSEVGFDKYYEFGCDNYIEASHNIDETIKSINLLDGNPEADNTQEVISQLEAQAEELESIANSLDRFPTPSDAEGQHEDFMQLISSEREELMKACEVLKYSERIMDDTTSKEYDELFSAFAEKVNEVNAKASSVVVNDTPARELTKSGEFLNAVRNFKEKKCQTDEKYAESFLSQYRKANADKNNGLKAKSEVVFLADSVQKGSDGLVLAGMFYNGTQDLVSGIGELLVDVTLYNFDDEVFSVKDIPYDVKITNAAVSPGNYVNCNIQIPADVKEVKFNHFDVNVHKIHWSIKRLVKR